MEMRNFFLFLLVTCSSLNAEYYHLDNKTIAQEDDLLDDPFLLIRVKSENALTPYTFTGSLKKAAIAQTHGKVTQEKRSVHSTQNELDYSAVRVLNEENFYYENLVFKLCIENNATQIWWQISPSPDFESPIPNFDQVDTVKNHIKIDELSETLLTPNQTYYFRARALADGKWSNWSEPFSFHLIKPEAPQNVHFEKKGKHFVIRWDPSTEEDVVYHIYGSCCLNFIPSCYKQIRKELPHLFEENLIATTVDHEVVVDRSLPFYRIIAEKKGKLSIPSELVRIYDYGLKHPRTTFKVDTLTGNLTYSLLEETKGINFVLPPNIGKAKPYLMPDNHPIKAKLDRIFKKKRPTHDRSTLEAAGFENGEIRRYSKCVVTKHNKIKGYFFKLYLDTQTDIPDELRPLCDRIKGANFIKKYIKEHRFEKEMKVPQKWLYLLPYKSSAPGTIKRDYILVAEDLKIHTSAMNYQLWASNLVTPDLLNKLYMVIRDNGMADCPIAFNVPFAKDGKIAFIDTQDHSRNDIPWDKMLKYLSPEMQNHWIKLMSTNGP